MVGYRMVVNVLVVYPHDHVADWEVGLPLPRIMRQYHIAYH